MELLDTVGLTDFADTVTVELSYGRKRALEIATTLAMDPELMLLDEPTQGMGHEDVDRVTELIRKVSANRTILMVEHNMGVVSRIADTISVLQRGQIIAEGPYEVVSRNPRCWKPTWAAPKPNCRAHMAESGRELLRLTDVHAWYGESHILHGIDLHVNQGEVVTLLGRNGAGRTTTLKSILGLVGRRTGSITVNGTETVAMPPHSVARLGIGYCPEERGIFASLSCEKTFFCRRSSRRAACRSMRSMLSFRT